jgi:hypothetical protein
MRKIASLIAVATALVALSPTPASAFVTLIVATYDSQATKTYATPVVIAPRGGPLTFWNQDIQVHNVTSDATGPSTQPWCRFFDAGACPLFWSPMTDLGQTSAVLGTENASSGETYGFHCVYHPSVRATLIVA